ncbi:iron-containing alcohol dehydrogenase [Gracilinema caldarium]|uniref:Alcohol dehydrogenase n=1 Tax=Gracilinema caldarium (strain ATCC 51460 / DSM 7334 / H1) TaxID=744872 RepID=F8EZJ2_GRAC1|nr:iron-containing alcohol dehydrogenase [Gracilinema caldarium]AEJ20215.1 Alcohol dehydrogenase [Gracilinema caldarium DSM 7334]
MIGAIASPTNIIELPQFTAAALDEVLVYSTGLSGAGNVVASTNDRTGAGAGPVLCIIDPRPFPLRDRVLADLGRRWKLSIMDQVVPNPASKDIMAMAEAARQQRPAAVLGIGGGSTLDSAKAVAMLLENPGDLDEYLGPDASRKPQSRCIPLLLIPTTTGTGSEVTRFGVYTVRSGRKYTLNSPVLQAETALLSPDLVADLPPALVAATGYDALTHALETLWNKNATALSDRLALEAAAAVLRSLEPAWRASQGQGPAAALAELQQAATLAGIAFNKTGTAAIHALSFILSEEWHLSHGAACAFFTQNIFDINMQDPAVRTKFLTLAKRVYAEAGESSASPLSDEGYLQYLRDRLVALKRLMGLPDRFSDIPGFTLPGNADEQEKIAALFDKAQNDFKLKNNPVPCTPELVRKLVLEKLQ